MLLRCNDERMPNLVSEAKSGGHISEFKVLCDSTIEVYNYAAQIWHSTWKRIMVLESWCSSHTVAGGLQSEIIGYSIS